jgi:hypothetical protein
MDRLLSAMAIFVEYPGLAAALGIVLVVAGRRSHRGVASAVGVVWLLYAFYEFGMKRRWLCSGECDIRVDLLVIYPALLIGLVAAGISLLRPRADTRPPA